MSKSPRVNRRQVLSGGTAFAVSAPALVRAASRTTLRFIPVIDLAFVDPVFSSAQVSRNHGYMVFDTLYGMNTKLEVSPQMVDGHTVEGDGLLWNLRLREGLRFHDGEPVLAKDCVASIKRWAKRDAFGDALIQATDELSAVDDRTIRFRLKRPFPYLPYALAKPAVPACFMMPERIAATDPFKVMTEVIGSGPFRFKADERVPGAFNAYERFEHYKARDGAAADWTAGAKIVHYDRVEWTTMPDASTGTAALRAGEKDWQETLPHDLLKVAKSNPSIRTEVLDPRGYACLLRVNHLLPPFDNPAIRRALLGAIDQDAFMTAVTGEDASYRHTPIGYFCPGTPMASDAGLDVFKGQRDFDKVKRDLKAAGYAGEKVVLLVPADSQAQKPLGDIAADTMLRAGMNVEYTALDFGSVLKRRMSKNAIDAGGWNAFAANFQGIDWLTPAGHVPLRGNGSYPGWSVSERTEGLRAKWLATAEPAEQQRLAREIQLVALEEVPYYPLGQYKQATAYRDSIAGVLSGTAVFWNVRPA